MAVLVLMIDNKNKRKVKQGTHKISQNPRKTQLTTHKQLQDLNNTQDKGININPKENQTEQKRQQKDNQNSQQLVSMNKPVVIDPMIVQLNRIMIRNNSLACHQKSTLDQSEQSDTSTCSYDDLQPCPWPYLVPSSPLIKFQPFIFVLQFQNAPSWSNNAQYYLQHPQVYISRLKSLTFAQKKQAKSQLANWKQWHLRHEQSLAKRLLQQKNQKYSKKINQLVILFLNRFRSHRFYRIFQQGHQMWIKLWTFTLKCQDGFVNLNNLEEQIEKLFRDYYDHNSQISQQDVENIRSLYKFLTRQRVKVSNKFRVWQKNQETPFINSNPLNLQQSDITPQLIDMICHLPPPKFVQFYQRYMPQRIIPVDNIKLSKRYLSQCPKRRLGQIKLFLNKYADCEHLYRSIEEADEEDKDLPDYWENSYKEQNKITSNKQKSKKNKRQALQSEHGSQPLLQDYLQSSSESDNESIFEQQPQSFHNNEPDQPSEQQSSSQSSSDSAKSIKSQSSSNSIQY